MIEISVCKSKEEKKAFALSRARARRVAHAQTDQATARARAQTHGSERSGRYFDLLGGITGEGTEPVHIQPGLEKYKK